MIELAQDPLRFLETVRPFLEKKEGEYGLFLGYVEMLVRKKFSAFLALDRDESSSVCGAALFRERNLILSDVRLEFIEALVAALEAEGVTLPGVVGPSQASEEFARAWSSRRGCRSVLAMDQKIYELRKVNSPQGIEGHARLMKPDENLLIARWMCAFQVEGLPHEPMALEDARKQVQEKSDSIFVWEKEGVAVSMAGLARPTRHGITINLVYTPPGFRKRGYASGVVAAASEEGLRRGKDFCILYTDLANPTSNSIYQKLGYVPIAGSRNYRFAGREER